MCQAVIGWVTAISSTDFVLGLRNPCLELYFSTGFTKSSASTLHLVAAKRVISVLTCFWKAGRLASNWLMMARNT